MGGRSVGRRWAEEARTAPWTRKLQSHNVFSTTKTMSRRSPRRSWCWSIAAELDLDASVANASRPEFAARGRQGIRSSPAPVAHLRASRAGSSQSPSRTCTTGTNRPPCLQAPGRTRTAPPGARTRVPLTEIDVTFSQKSMKCLLPHRGSTRRIRRASCPTRPSTTTCALRHRHA